VQYTDFVPERKEYLVNCDFCFGACGVGKTPHEAIEDSRRCGTLIKVGYREIELFICDLCEDYSVEKIVYQLKVHKS